jgi:hypothetical protein
VHFLGWQLAAEKEEFEAWFREWGNRIYLPILMKLPGLKAINCFTFTGRSSQPEIKDPGYPDFLSLWYFDTPGAFRNFEKSPELAAFFKALKADFPEKIRLKWHARYELYKTYRR